MAKQAATRGKKQGRQNNTAAAARGDAKKARLMSPEMAALTTHRGRQLAGVILLMLVVLAALALISYAPDDPSLNRATPAPARNWLGLPGAIVADLMLQTLGFAAVFVLLVGLVWAIRLMRGRSLLSIGWRLILLPAALLTGAITVAAALWWTSDPADTGAGGFVGRLSYGGLKTLLHATDAGISPLLIGIVAGLVTLFLLILVFGMTWHEWRAVGGALKASLRWLGLPVGRKQAVKKTPPAKASRKTEKAAEKARRKEQKEQEKQARAAAKAATRTAKKTKDKSADKAKSGKGRTGRDLPTLVMDPVASSAPDSVPAGQDPDAAALELTEPAAAPNANGKTKKRSVVAVPKAASKTASKPGPAKAPRAGRSKQGELLDAGKFDLPDNDLLQPARASSASRAVDEAALEQNARYLESVLQDFGVKGEIVRVRPGPVVTLYELEPAPGTKSARVINLADDIARSMAAVSVRVAVVPGKNVIGIELPNQNRETVYLRELLESDDFDDSNAKLSLILGKDIGGQPVIADLARMPHLLIAGTTGSGKSVGINTMILSLLYRLPPDRCKFIMVDPKMLELSIYDDIPQLLAPVVTDPKKAVVALRWAVREMENRYQKMSKMGVRNIDGFNQRVADAAQKGEEILERVRTGIDEKGRPEFEEQPMSLEQLPYIVVIVDEMADLMLVAGKDIEGAVQRLAQMARAAGIHLIMATQRPSVDVITGTIKANFPTRISFQVTSKIDSRTILGEQGAEQLLGQGDMLYMAGGGRITRVHGPFVSDEEVERVVAHLKAQGTPDYIEEVTEADEEEGGDIPGIGANSGDELYDKAVAIVVQEGKCSTSFIQRKLQIGYNRAARLVEQMEEQGIVSPANHAGKREILVGNV